MLVREIFPLKPEEARAIVHALRGHVRSPAAARLPLYESMPGNDSAKELAAAYARAARPATWTVLWAVLVQLTEEQAEAVFDAAGAFWELISEEQAEAETALWEWTSWGKGKPLSPVRSADIPAIDRHTYDLLFKVGLI